MLKDIKGVGDKVLEKLNMLGIHDEEELINYLPKSYLDMGKLTDLSEVSEGDYALIKATITEITPYRKIRQGLGIVKATAYQDGERLSLTWFNMPYIASNIKTEEYYIFGKLGKYKNEFSFTNPTLKQCADINKFVSVSPIYPLKELIPQGTFRKIMESAIDKSSPRTNIPLDIKKAYLMAHFPPGMEQMYQAHTELALNELVGDLIEYRRYRATFTTKNKLSKNAVIDDLIARLEYKLTDSQLAAVQDILSDLASVKPMNRLLLGDVGSGKTIVALLTLYANSKAGYQGVLLAPTEVLATQHYNNAIRYLSPLGINVAKLSGGMTASEKNSVKQQLVTNTLLGRGIDIIIGTHSCISDDVIYSNLGLVVIDELQKFGVKQKAGLIAKGVNIDCLVMSATPMPRTLAMIMYGDLTVSKLALRDTQLPVKTYIMHDDKLSGMYNYIRGRIERGEQAFIICPRVEDGDGLEIMSSKALYKTLQTTEFKGYNIGLIHGKMTAADKEKIMSQFINNEISVLVATSLLEVGIDVPNATVMCIIASDSFGLSSLHQLRGRVGRGKIAGECYLHVKTAKAPERISAMRECNDGIKLAEIDAELRGLGDIIGIRQSGRTGYEKYRIKVSRNMVERAKEYADKAPIDNAISGNTSPLSVLLN